ncbi:hypothetical protein [Neorhodopirellula pilleata]|uniref:Ankyrin repeats (3 copies) n=1 Tax=Neorhodopirellula pilleata TaxID=2714738 RepID=A0A5C6ADV8_9BACT|nr:hypothetical protein [Neorhodopirellula pilleata]TWT97365.1 hypothetical protein Pla100_25170 [Neorhodopirellula pilleata]
MYASDKARFAKTPLAQRRGIYLSNYPDSWFQFALRNASDPAVLKERLKGIGHVTEDVTKSVLEKNFRPPVGAWTLLIHLNFGSWSILPMMQRSPELLDDLGGMIEGEYVIIRHSDCSGVYSIMRFCDGRKMDHIYSDGELWDDDEEDYDDEFEDEDEDEAEGEDEDDSIDFDLNGVRSDTYTMEWLTAQPDLFSAMHQIMVDWDALIPDYWWDEESGLTAYQKELCGTKLIKRIDLIRFGEMDDRANEQASKVLVDSIRGRDIDGVRQALSDGASLTQLPETELSAIDLLCNYLPAGDKNVVEIAELLLAAGANADGRTPLGKSKSKKKTPLTQAIGANFSSPRMMFDLANLLVRHGGRISADPNQGLDESPLEAAFNRADPAWMRWALNFDQPPEMLEELLKRHRRGLKQMASFVDDDYAAEQQKRYEPIVAMVQRAIAGEPLDDVAIEATIDKSDAEYRRKHNQLRQAGTGFASEMERLAGTYATENVDGETIPVFGGFDITLSWIESVPSELNLVSADLSDWAEEPETQAWVNELESQAFKPVGHFRDEGGWIELIAHCQPFRDLYAVIERIGDDVCHRIIRRLTGNRLIMATNQKRMWNQTIENVEVHWVTHRDPSHLFLRPIMAATKDSETASIEGFQHDYAMAHQLLHQKLRQVAV